MNNYQDELFAALQRLLPHHTLSRLVAKLAETRSKQVKNQLIKLFIKQYNINLDELDKTSPEDYPTFNDFFTRPLKDGARPISPQADVIVSPADGTISQMGVIQQGEIIQAKGKNYSVESLLGRDLAAKGDFDQGLFSTIYLSPSDYHRSHMPFAAELIATRYIPGELFSVNQVTAEQIDHLFARNERLVCLFDSELGKFAMVLVGAMLVAGIESTWHGHYLPEQPADQSGFDLQFAKGDEMGRFKFGSTVILLFERNRMNWEKNIQIGDTLKMGQTIGQTEKA